MVCLPFMTLLLGTFPHDELRTPPPCNNAYVSRLQNGASISACDQHCRTALHYALHLKSIQVWTVCVCVCDPANNAHHGTHSSSSSYCCTAQKYSPESMKPQ